MRMPFALKKKMVAACGSVAVAQIANTELIIDLHTHTQRERRTRLHKHKQKL